MADLPIFPSTHVTSKTSWSNYTATISGRPIGIYCIPEGGTDVSVLRKHGDSLRAILQYCFDRNQPLRVLGSAWSFSRVVEPSDVVLDPGNMNFIEPVPSFLFTASYRTRAVQGFTPMFIEGGTQIADINRRLANDVRLALQTSGAGDGHRLAGALATGTHGSALGIGALHDTVLAVYLMVAPNQALLVQSASSPVCTDAAAAWLQNQTGVPTAMVTDDDQFHAALVALGSLGVVFGVVVETVPLYQLRYSRVVRPWSDQAVWAAIRTLDTTPLHPETAATPYHFDVVMHPYPPNNGPGLFASMMWKVPAEGVPATSPLPAIPLGSSDLMSLVARLTQSALAHLLQPLTQFALQQYISSELANNAANAQGRAFPGEMFGPTTLPPGSGASTEIVVDHGYAELAINAVYTALQQRAAASQFLLGCIGVRFVPQTRALLGMNIGAMNCYIELPSIRNDDVLAVYRAVWEQLASQNIPFTCHWGQLHGMTAQRLAHYFGHRVNDWKAARYALLASDSRAAAVFAAPLLADLGLDGPPEASLERSASAARPVLLRGSRGPDVSAWQAAIGVNADGIFGFGTEEATRAWQAAHRLAPDGVVGRNTWASVQH